MNLGRERVSRKVVAIRPVLDVGRVDADRCFARRYGGEEVSVRVAVPVAVVVRVPREGVHRVVVRDAVAVLVHAVADLVRVGGHGRIVVVAVGVIGVGVRRTLVRAGHDGGDVLGGRGASVAVHIRVPGPHVDGSRFRVAVAVLVDAHVVEIAVLRGTRVHVDIGVVTVVGVRDVALDVLTHQHGERGVAVAVAVTVEGLAGDGVVVHRSVAVVVEAVAELRGVLVDARVAVDAVLVVLHLALGQDAGFHEGVDVAVPVAVHVAVGLEGRAGRGVDRRVDRVVDRERGVDGLGRVGGGGGGGAGQEGQNEHGDHGAPGAGGFGYPTLGGKTIPKKRRIVNHYWLTFAISNGSLINCLSETESLKRLTRCMTGVYFSNKLMNSFQITPYKTFGDVETSAIRYISNGHWVHGFLAMPKGEAGPLPCIIFNRGGSFDFGVIDDVTLEKRISLIASWGYVVIASQYSGNGGSEGQDELGGADVEDVVRLKEYIKDIPQADVSRIGMIGGSRGGQMTYQSLARVDWLKAAVSIAGLADLNRQIVLRPEMIKVFEQGFDNTAEGRKERSAIAFADRLCKTTPLLMLHGTADWRVSPKDSLELSVRLLEARVPHRLVMFEGGDHGLAEHRKEEWEMIRIWFKRFVKDGEVLPDLEPHGV